MSFQPAKSPKTASGFLLITLGPILFITLAIPVLIFFILTTSSSSYLTPKTGPLGAGGSTGIITTDYPSCWPTNGYISNLAPHGVNRLNGFDIGMDALPDQHQPIYASHSGTVVTASASGECTGGYGICVIIRGTTSSGEVFHTMYGHMYDRPVVAVGQEVGRGTLLGYVGSTGISDGNHLHYELRGEIWAQVHGGPDINLFYPGVRYLQQIIQNCTL